MDLFNTKKVADLQKAVLTQVDTDQALNRKIEALEDLAVAPIQDQAKTAFPVGIKVSWHQPFYIVWGSNGVDETRGGAAQGIVCGYKKVGLEVRIKVSDGEECTNHDQSDLTKVKKGRK